jgi:hypothetical protein
MSRPLNPWGSGGGDGGAGNGVGVEAEMAAWIEGRDEMKPVH